ILAKIGFVQATSLALSILVVLGSIIVALVLSRHISVPLTALTNLAKAASAGDLTQRVTINRKDEIGILAQIFNAMLGNLQATMASQVAKEYLETVINEYQ